MRFTTITSTTTAKATTIMVVVASGWQGQGDKLLRSFSSCAVWSAVYFLAPFCLTTSSPPGWGCCCRIALVLSARWCYHITINQFYCPCRWCSILRSFFFLSLPFAVERWQATATAQPPALPLRFYVPLINNLATALNFMYAFMSSPMFYSIMFIFCVVSIFSSWHAMPSPREWWRVNKGAATAKMWLCECGDDATQRWREQWFMKCKQLLSSHVV